MRGVCVRLLRVKADIFLSLGGFVRTPPGIGHVKKTHSNHFLVEIHMVHAITVIGKQQQNKPTSISSRVYSICLVQHLIWLGVGTAFHQSIVEGENLKYWNKICSDYAHTLLEAAFHFSLHSTSCGRFWVSNIQPLLLIMLALMLLIFLDQNMINSIMCS